MSSLNQYVARDALGFNLNYFHGDYLAINPGVNPFPSYRTPSNGLPDTEYRPLYNGNISSMVSYIRKFEAVNHNLPIFYNYRYDQLNRYVRQDSYFGFNKATNTYGAWTPDSTFRERVAYDANGNIQTFVRHAINQGGALMDNLTYKYYTGTNQLRQVNDVVADNSYGTNPSNPVVDIDNQTDTSNYVYDAIGNLIQDKAEKITNIQWNVYGKITEITRNSLTTDRVTTTRTRYTYDAQGNRISKVTKYYNKDSAKYKLDYTWYVRDAQGNLLSTYTVDRADTSVADLGTLALKQADVQLYGSSRLGNLPPRNSVVDQASNTGPWINPVYRGTTYYRGDRQYELTNHLGNVLTTISDRKIPVYSGSSLNLPGGYTVPIADYFEPDMVSATDYYPFGMVSRGIGPSDKYRFGFNGKENDNEVKGFANQVDFGERMYDNRIGRWFAMDKVNKSYLSPYQFSSNSPTNKIDPDGKDEIHFHFLGSYTSYGSKGPAQFKGTAWIEIIKTNGPDKFYHHKHYIQNFNGKTIANTERVTQFYPFIGDSRSGLTSTAVPFTFGILSRNDRDIHTLSKYYGASPAFRQYLEERIKDPKFKETENYKNYSEVLFPNRDHYNRWGKITKTAEMTAALVSLATASLSIVSSSAATTSSTSVSLGGGRIFNHFTDGDAISGITGVSTETLNNMKLGQSLIVNELKFGKGANTFMANNAGDIFVTEVGTDASVGKLNLIGVFGDKQNFAISFSEESAFFQGAKVRGVDPSRSIFTIPGNTTLKGTFKITKTR